MELAFVPPTLRPHVQSVLVTATTCLVASFHISSTDKIMPSQVRDNYLDTRRTHASQSYPTAVYDTNTAVVPSTRYAFRQKNRAHFLPHSMHASFSSSGTHLVAIPPLGSPTEPSTTASSPPPACVHLESIPWLDHRRRAWPIPPHPSLMSKDMLQSSSSSPLPSSEASSPLAASTAYSY